MVDTNSYRDDLLRAVEIMDKCSDAWWGDEGTADYDDWKAARDLVFATASRLDGPSDRKDAERYRFLREHLRLIRPGDPFIARSWNGAFSRWTNEEADKTVDEAMADQTNATQESKEFHFDADKIGEVLRREAQERSDELGHTIARGVRRLKQLADLRVPPYDLPADSFLEDAVRDILSLRIKHDHRRNREPR